MPLRISINIQGDYIKGATGYAFNEVLAVLTQIRTFLYFIN